MNFLKLNYLTKIYSYIFILYCCLASASIAYANCSIDSNDKVFEQLSYIDINISNKKKWQKNLAKLLSKKIYSDWNNDESKASKTKKKHKATVKFQFKDGVVCEFSSEIRFHGDGSDHIDFKNGFPISSMNVKLKEGNINNIVNFILYIPKTRNKDNEIFTTTFLKHVDFLAPDTFYANVKMNGKFQRFIFQEKIRKEFLERNELVEGPIFGGHENFYRYDDFERVARILNSNWIKQGNNDRLDLAYDLLEFINLLYLKDPKLNLNSSMTEFPFLEIDLENLYENEIKKFSEFDAMMYVLSGYHSLRGDNRRFYYHPILHEFLPIYYDGEVTILNKTVEDFFLDFENNHKRSEYDMTHFPIPPYSVSVGIDGIKKYLDKVDIDILKSQLKSRGLDLSKKKLNFVLDRMVKRFHRLKSATIEKPDLNLNPSVYKKYSSNNLDRLVFRNDKKNNFIHCNFLNSSCKKINLELKDQIKLLKQDYKKKDSIEYQYINSNFNEYRDGKIYRKKLGIKKYKNQLINNSFNIKYNQFIKININKEKKILEIKQMDQKGRVIISNSTIRNWKVLFHGNNTAKISKLVEDNLTGCVTIINSKIKNFSFTAKNVPCEDAVNFINTKGNIKEIVVKDSISDAIDADFSELIFESVTSSSSKNDCFDVSFGIYFLVNGIFKNCGDKAISVGEKSSLNITNALIENSNIGLASKDSAFVKAKNLNISNVEFCLSSYNKKQEFFGGKLIVDRLNCKNYSIKIQKDDISSIEIKNNL